MAGAPDPDPVSIVGILADEDRLRAFAAIALEARSEADIAERAGLSSEELRRALGRLVAAGLVETTATGLRARTEVFGAAARAASMARRSAEPSAEELGATPEQARRIQRFLRAGRLVEIPTGAAARRAVLDFLAGKFEPGRRYAEAEVNAVIARFHDDTAALRRFLVDEDFLTRERGEYWRSGGTFDVD
ncbi:MAG TPA: DUF2087 domain-containing protein [Acidimicrobiales bacterium]|nr:DUF2087 domain-containing protein [Acidimicrobiales bacterium]